MLGQLQQEGRTQKTRYVILWLNQILNVWHYEAGTSWSLSLAGAPMIWYSQSLTRLLAIFAFVRVNHLNRCKTCTSIFVFNLNKLWCRGTGTDLPLQSDEAMAFGWMSGLINQRTAKSNFHVIPVFNLGALVRLAQLKTVVNLMSMEMTTLPTVSDNPVLSLSSCLI